MEKARIFLKALITQKKSVTGKGLSGLWSAITRVTVADANG